MCIEKLDIDGTDERLNESNFESLLDSVRVSTSLKRLVLRNLDLDAIDPVTLVPAIKNSRNLKSIAVGECDGDIGRSLSIGAFWNRSIRTVTLSSCRLSSSLGFMLESSSLEELRLTHAAEVDNNFAAALASGLSSSTKLRVLDLTGNGLSDKDIRILSDALCESNVHSLFLVSK